MGVSEVWWGRFEGGTGLEEGRPNTSRFACSARQCAGHAILSRRLSLVVMPTLAGKAARK